MGELRMVIGRSRQEEYPVKTFVLLLIYPNTITRLADLRARNDFRDITKTLK